MSVSDDDLRSRVALAAISEPGDSITGDVVRLVGAEEALRLVNSDGPLPARIDVLAGELWRQRLCARFQNGLVDRVLESSDRLGLRMILPRREGWAEGLDNLGQLAPLMLWTRGDISVLNSSLGSRVTIVGARAATGYGEHVTGELAGELAALPRVVVSGGAYGIDGAAHRAALAARAGSTIAVLASGLDRYYPAGNQELLSRVAQSGAVVSELPPGAAPTRWRFLQRNRILAAISAATIVVEAGYRSGFPEHRRARAGLASSRRGGARPDHLRGVRGMPPAAAGTVSDPDHPHRRHHQPHRPARPTSCPHPSCSAAASTAPLTWRVTTHLTDMITCPLRPRPSANGERY
ncbi:DNA-processing protein DprA [Microbacterium hominis]|uniref:DNA-processing protein DprA n=1 Tax=Microbacterium hominis TaxID=162426 RepID=UPI0023DD1C83|nr:DNA-processing protein DprA [Microbacterium hominis]